MFKHKHSFRKPDPLLLLVILVGMAVLMTSAVDAVEPAEPFYNTLSLTDLLDREIMLAPIGRHGASMNMSYQANPDRYEATSMNHVYEPRGAVTPTLYLSVKVPW